MTALTIGSDNPNISPTLRQAVSTTALQVELDLSVLSEEDLSDLKAILKGEKQTNVLIDRKRALNALIRSERSSETQELTARTLTDDRQSSRVRSLAALNLSLLPTPETEQILIRALHTEDFRLQASVVRSLGRIGSERAFEQLAKLDNAPNAAVRRQVSFAKQVIAYRSNSSAPALRTLRSRTAVAFRSAASTLDESARQARSNMRWSTFPASVIEGQSMQDKLSALWDSTYGLTLNQELALEIECGSHTKHFLFLNENLQKGKFMESVRSRSNILGLVALQVDEHVKHLNVRYLLLAHPFEDRLDLVVTRTNGDPIYVGEGKIEDRTLQFTMQDTELARFPTNIEGELSQDNIQFNLHIGQQRQQPKQHGEAM